MADSTSSQSSGVTGGDLSGFLEQDEVSDLDLFEKEPTSSEWTDEKHSMYLKSIENSFVHQLYSSMESSGLYSHMNHVKSSKHSESQASDQFKVYQHGWWQNIKVGRGEPPPRRAGKCRVLLQNPWIQHYRNRERDDQIIEGNGSSGYQQSSSGGRKIYTRALANVSDDFPICRTIGDSSIDEGFSGQNFDEEDNNESTCILRTSKRMKTVEAEAHHLE